MKIVTAGQAFLDIDAYACMYAYAELLNATSQPAQAASYAPFNASIPATVRDWGAELVRNYEYQKLDEFILVDISDPDFFDSIVPTDAAYITEVIDHHPGFETYWHEKIGKKAEIREVGACATQIYSRFEQFDVMPSKISARLLVTAILDNTLNFNATITSNEDRLAYLALSKIANLGDDWPRSYFLECQKLLTQNLEEGLKNDTKYIRLSGLNDRALVGQVVIWSAAYFMQKRELMYAALGLSLDQIGFINVIDICRNCNYFLTQNEQTKHWLMSLFSVTFDQDVARTDRTYLRKEIIRKDIDR